MNITNESRKMIVDEINFVIKMMDKNPDLDQKLYYFTGIHALIQRIYNQDFDEDLVFVHLIFVHVYESFIQRLRAITQGGDRSIILHEEQINKLTTYLKEFLKAIEKNESIDNILKKFVILSYSTTGNGFYLLQKGILKI